MSLNNGFWILRFKNPFHAKDAPPHYHVTIVCGLKNLCLPITSEVNKRKVFYKRSSPVARGCLVEVQKDDFPFLRYTSVIDCNCLDEVEPVEYEIIVRPEGFPQKIKQKVLKAIRKSPLVKPRLKKIIDREFSFFLSN